MMYQCVLAEDLAWHTMYSQTFSKLIRQISGNQSMHLVTNDSAGFSCNRHRTCGHHTAWTIALTSDYSLIGRQRFTIATFCKRLGLLFPTRGNTGVDTHTAWQAVYNGDRRIRFQDGPVLVIAALYAVFWGFSALPLTLSWLNNHSTLTVYRYTRHLTPAPTVSTTLDNPELNELCRYNFS